MTQPTFKGQQLHIGDEYKVTYISGNWIPGVKDYGTFIGELRSANPLPENKKTVYHFNNVKNHELAKTMPQEMKDAYVDKPTKEIHNWAIESIEYIEPDEVVYKPRRLSKGGKRKTNKKTKNRRGKTIKKKMIK